MGADAHGAGRGRPRAELGEIAWAELGQLVILPVTPDVFGRIEFRRVARQWLDYQPATLRMDEVADHSSPAHRQLVPYHQQHAFEVAEQMAEEFDYVRAADRARVEPEVEVPPDNGGDGRQHLLVKWYCTPVRYSMRSRTRRAVHSPVAKLNAAGPRLSARSRLRSCTARSLGGRPVRLTRRRPQQEPESCHYLL